MPRIRPRLIAKTAALTLGPLVALTVLVNFLFPPDPNELLRYAADDKRLLAAEIRPDVVFIGDSLTDNWTIVSPESWDRSWVNRGVGGQTSREVRARFAQDVLALHPRVVHILVGLNDIGGQRGPLPLSETEANIAAMASRARAAAIRVVLGTAERVPQWAWKRKPNDGEGHIEQLNAWIRAYAARTHATVADYWTVMDPAMTSDGVHPTAAGYETMARVARKSLAKT